MRGKITEQKSSVGVVRSISFFSSVLKMSKMHSERAEKVGDD